MNRLDRDMEELQARCAAAASKIIIPRLPPHQLFLKLSRNVTRLVKALNAIQTMGSPVSAMNQETHRCVNQYVNRIRKIAQQAMKGVK